MSRSETAAPARLESANAAASSVARVRAIAQATQRDFNELLRLDELLQTLAAGAEAVAHATEGTPTGEVEPLGSLGSPPTAADTSSVGSGNASSWESACRVWRAGLEAHHLFHVSGLSTTFAALECRVGGSAAPMLFGKLDRVRVKVDTLSAFAHDCAQQGRRRRSLWVDEQAWTRSAATLLHQLAHTPLPPEPDDDPATAPQVGSEGAAVVRRSEALAHHCGLWAALEQELHNIASPWASDLDVSTGRQEQQRRRLKHLVEEMEAVLLGSAP